MINEPVTLLETTFVSLPSGIMTKK